MNIFKRSGKFLLLSIMIFVIACVPVYAQDAVSKDQAGLLFLVLLILAIPEILGWTALALVWRGLFPKRLEYTSRIVRRLSWSSFWFGLTSFVVLFAVVALLASVADALIPLALLIAAAYLLMFVSFGKVAVIEWVGEVVDPSSTGMKKPFLGVTAIYFLLFIPFVGWLLVLGLAMMGIGAAIYSWFPTQPVHPVENVSTETAPE